MLRLSFLVLCFQVEALFAQGRYFSIFNIVQFPNTQCTGTQSRNGTCYTNAECETRGGVNSGSCASGFGVCCTIFLGCGGMSSNNFTYIEMRSFTASSALTSNPCTYTICRNSNHICRIRLDFTTFMLASPFTPTVQNAPPNGPFETGAGGDCTTDTFSFRSPGSQGSPIICGFNTGQHMILDASPSCNSLDFNIGDSGTTSRSWSIQVTQYECGDTNSQGGPPGCLQYFTGSSGQFSSFNYPRFATDVPTNSAHLSSQCYTICFRQEVMKCSICYGSALMGKALFGLNRSPNANSQSAIDSQCTDDFIQIPFGVASGQTATASATTSTKFCGRFLNPNGGQAVEASVCSFSAPFRVDFKTDTDEFCSPNTDASTCEAAGNPGGTIGFFLKFAQIDCM